MRSTLKIYILWDTKEEKKWTTVFIANNSINQNNFRMTIG
jgi:hypothetical protein